MGRRHDHVLTAVLVATPLALFGAADRVRAEPTPAAVSEPVVDAAHAVLGPVLTSDGAAAKGDKEIALRRVSPSDPFAPRAREVDIALREAAQDLGLALDLGLPLGSDGARDADLIKSASSGHWAISPRLELVGTDAYQLRMVAVPPGSSTLLVRFERVDGKHLAARAVVMLRDFVTLKLGAAKAQAPAEDSAPRADEDEGARSRGRPVLAASSTLFGLYTAFAIHSVAGNDDPRLLYPLLALGSGIGLGASLLASDEWNVTSGSAWTIAAGSWWGVVAGSSLAAGRNVRPVNDRYAWGLVGGLIGTTAAVAATAITHYNDGDATLVHSGAALGTFTGGITELLIRGTLKEGASTGLGLGAGIGLVGGGVLAAFTQTTAQRVMLVDLGAGLGALAGASVASPLVFRTETAGRTRLFLGAVLAGTAIGGTIAWIATRQSKPDKTALRISPTVAAFGTPELPAYGAGFAGSF